MPGVSDGGWGVGVEISRGGWADFVWSLWTMAYEGHFRGRLRLPLARRA
ncbi:hypothetical protein BJ998_000297 [Kutzneria kofuensis]|uniref:Uncharacterized protein n=1 Tax=Kutzneria kofuensis TaxID=103725 RepID=A0A7W9NEG0_9PSEU|nr:hypothetical protein [Kutzneria kofuensis]